MSKLLKIWYYCNLTLASGAVASNSISNSDVEFSWKTGYHAHGGEMGHGSWMDHAQRGEVDASVDDRDLPNSFLLLPQFSCRARNLTSVARNATYQPSAGKKTYLITITTISYHLSPSAGKKTYLGCFHIGGQSCCCVVCCAFWSKTSLWYFDWQFQRIEHQIYFPAKNFFTLTWNLQKSFNFSSFYFILLNVLHKLHLINLLYTPGNLDMQKSWRSCTSCQLKVKTKTKEMTFNLNWKCH